MEILNQLEKLPGDLSYLVVTLGNFDGVHRGHHALIDELTSRAAANDGQSLIFTFEPHPLAVLAPHKEPPPSLTTKDEKIEILQGAGINYLLNYQFTKKLSKLSAWDFADKFLHKGLRAKEIIIGPNFQFGYKRQGNPALLQGWSEELAFGVKVVDPVMQSGEVISSSRIRAMLQEGKIADASRLLGYDYFLKGKVIKGASRGRELGFPTLNMELPDKLIPPKGVYVTKAFIGDNWYLGVSNLGVRPTFEETVLTLETHFLDYREVNPPQDVKLHFLKRLRNEMTFSSVDALVGQIGKDIEEARKL